MNDERLKVSMKVSMNIIRNFDNTVMESIRTHMRCRFLDFVMPFITKLGNAAIIWIVVALAFLNSGRYHTYGFVLICSLLACFLIGNLTLKPLVERTRPCDMNTVISLLIARPTDFSFPSGHTMSSFAAACVIFQANTNMGVAAFILASLIAFSRLYLYVHYPSDILAGIIIGVLISVVVIWLFNVNLGYINHSL